MSVKPTGSKRQQSTAEPLENQMWDREGFDRRGIRREFAGVRQLSLEDKYVQQDDQTYVDPRSINMPVGPTAMGDFGGQGVEMLRIEGDRWPAFRWTSGFEVLAEDRSDVSEQRNAILELFDYFADVAFLTGIGPDGQYADGMFDWLRDAIPEERTFDCAEYVDGEYDDRPENIIRELALSEVDGRLMDMESASWDLMVGSQRALSTFNKVSGEDGGVAGDTYFERLDSPLAGINDWSLVPESISPMRVPYTDGEDAEKLLEEFEVDLVNTDADVVEESDENGVIGTDEVIVLPDMEAVRENMLAVYEVPEPEQYGPISLRGGKEAYDYAWRYTQRFNPKRRHPEATDCLRLTNISEIFN